MPMPMKIPTNPAHPTLGKVYEYDGKQYSYGAAHKWVHEYHGKALKCENSKCPGKSVYYTWSNISHKYKKERSDWQMLCASCHGKYDQTPVNRESVRRRSYGNNFRSIPVMQYSMSDKFIKSWVSSAAATKVLGLYRTGIYDTINGKQKSAGGYKWKVISQSTKKVS